MSYFGNSPSPVPLNEQQIADAGDPRYVNVSGDTLTGSLELPVGNTSVTSVSIGSNTNTGFYQPSSGQIGIVTGGTERIRVDASGNVGIGILNPLRKLHIAASSSEAALRITTPGNSGGDLGMLEIANPAGNTVALIGQTGDGNGLRIQSNSGIRFNTNVSSAAMTGTNERMIIDGNGNVGIGTISPATIVHVGDGTDPIAMTGTAPLLAVKGASFTTGIIARRDGFAEIGIQSAGTGNIGTFTNHSLVLNTNGIERMRVSTGGNVTINTAETWGGHYFGVSGGSVVPMYLERSTDGGITTYYRAGVVVGSVSVSSVGTTYNTSSDYRLKDQITDLENSGIFIDSLRPREWIWKSTGEKGSGFVAHEAQEVTPSSVTGEKDDEKMQQMSYSSSEIIANIVAELKSLRARVAQLESM